MMPRVFHPHALDEGAKLRLTGPVGHHYARVLRVSEGDTIPVVAAGIPRAAIVEAVNPGHGSVDLTLGPVLPRRDPATRVYLVQGLPKGDKMETIIQKCTEIGVAGIHVAACARSVSRLTDARAAGKLERWRRIAEQAASQAQRDAVPDVWYSENWRGLSDWLEECRPALVVLCDEAETARSLADTVEPLRQSPQATEVTVVVAVGPEGGWSEEERLRWQALGAQPVTLGGRILRTETAGLVALTAVLYALGDLGGRMDAQA
jgi:16S rRNA (uracil1498-N3)-methyltransferase